MDDLPSTIVYGGANPLVLGGRIVNMEAFLAFLEHVHGQLTTTYHNTPIVLMTSPQWTRPDCEAIALYIFEKTRTPALCMINSALATQYGLKWPHMTVVDIGFEKVDVTCIYDSRVVNHMVVGYAGESGGDRAISGGEVFTRRLQTLLRNKSFTHEMAEQLKRSNVCEVLPYAPEHPRLMELPAEDVAAAAAPAASSGPAAVLPAAAGTDDPLAAGAAQPAVPVAAADDDDAALDDAVVGVAGAEDGVLDVATIVTSGQTKEFLAKKEKERSERGRFGRRNKDKEAEAAAAKPVRLPNAKRSRVTFHFEELVEDDEPEPAPQPTSNGYHQANGSALGGGSGGSKSAATGGTSGKGDDQDEEAEGSEEGSEDDEDEEGEEDEEGDGNGDDEEQAEGTTEASKADKTPAEEKAPSGEQPAKAEDADKSKEEGATVKAEEPTAAAPAEEAPKEKAAEPAEPIEPAKDAPEEPEAKATALAVGGATEDATMEDAPATAGDAADASAAPKVADAPAVAATEQAKQPATTSTEVVPVSTAAAAVVVEAPAAEERGRRYKRLRRDFEIGLERFTFAERFEIDRIATTIYRTVQGIEDMYMRPACWENLVFVGNGCRLRGLRDNILQTLQARYLVSPSTATMFTSELPSNLGTPSGTGAQTPTGQFNTPPHMLPTSSSVNPLLQAATTASLLGAGAQGSGGPGSVTGGAGSGDAGGHSHHFHAQTPTTIKLATLPTYLGEWTKNGFEEAMFLGAQVAARLAFCVHNLDAQGQEAQRQMSLTRVDYKYAPPLLLPRCRP